MIKRFKEWIMKFNNWLALHMTLAAGTIWCFYLFLALCLLPVMVPAYQISILYISNCFQLILLPVIMVGQTLLGATSEKRAIEDHDAIMAELGEIKEMHEEIKIILKDVNGDKPSV